MRLPSVTISVCGEAVEVLYAGIDKGEALRVAKSACNGPVDQLTEVRVLSAQSVAFRKRLVPAKALPDPEAVEPEEEASAPESVDAAELRALLKAKGVNVPPRIGDEKLIALAVEHGVG